MFIGVIFGVAACMIWGLVYLVPLVLPTYDPGMIAAARFVSFGLIAGPLAWIERHEFARYEWRDWFLVAQLGVIGNIVYYILLILCIQNAGAPMAGMCMSLIPILVTLVTKLRDRSSGQVLSWMGLMPGLILIAAGIVLANCTEFDYIVQTCRGTPGQFWFGAAMGGAALLVWTWYPIRNADWLRSHPERSARTWSTGQGLTTLPFAVVMLVVMWAHRDFSADFLGPDPMWFILVTATSGILCSWLGIVLWNEMSQRLPTAISGQMIVFETVFAVIYAHMLRASLPSWQMALGMVMLIGGVLATLRAFSAMDRASTTKVHSHE